MNILAEEDAEDGDGDDATTDADQSSERSRTEPQSKQGEYLPKR